MGEHPARVRRGREGRFHPALSTTRYNSFRANRTFARITENPMADGADKLAKLARLKNLKSGLNAKRDMPADDGEDLTLDSVLGSGEGDAPVVEAPARAASAPPPPDTAPPPPAPSSRKAEPEGESLSAYFEALGIVPDNAKFGAGSGGPPKPYDPPSSEYTKPRPETPKVEESREVDARDRWVDPVREDDTFLSSFAGEGTPPRRVAEEPEDEDIPSLDSIIGSLDEDGDAPDISTAEDPAEDAPPPEEDSDFVLMDAEPPDEEKEPDAFGKPVDIEAFEKEIGLSDAGPASSRRKAPPPDGEPGSDTPLTITFDESRATLLTHVSKQMGCTIDDVVVTAIDWYLDALFGEDDPEMGAGAGE